MSCSRLSQCGWRPEIFPSAHRVPWRPSLLPRFPPVLNVSLRFQSGYQPIQLVAEGRFDAHACGNLLAGIDDGGVIAPSEQSADFGQRKLRELPEEIHGDLPRKSDRMRPPTTAQG